MADVCVDWTKAGPVLGQFQGIPVPVALSSDGLPVISWDMEPVGQLGHTQRGPKKKIPGITLANCNAMPTDSVTERPTWPPGGGIGESSSMLFSPSKSRSCRKLGLVTCQKRKGVLGLKFRNSRGSHLSFTYIPKRWTLGFQGGWCTRALSRWLSSADFGPGSRFARGVAGGATALVTSACHAWVCLTCAQAPDIVSDNFIGRTRKSRRPSARVQPVVEPLKHVAVALAALKLRFAYDQSRSVLSEDTYGQSGALSLNANTNAARRKSTPSRTATRGIATGQELLSVLGASSSQPPTPASEM
ncbi:unnamed protein product [Phytophthora fragariaefolia]|uniref:Unnamed protein product n=1 Tax=Phytophthora fragariaefolia TaxID=1490495 RepID=A0A9W6X534_9STRA|nr:unnamed protein product [Phytophthora fragariaefolia]